MAAESPTSSVSPPTESNSVETAEVTKVEYKNEKFEYKIEGGLKVDARSKAQWLMSVDPQFQNNKTAVKCSSCQMLTIHVSLMVSMYFYTDSVTADKPLPVERRIVGCAQCGKISCK